VNSTSQNVDFGTFGPGEVSAISGPTRPVTFQVQCTGPTPPQSIVGSFTGTPDTANPAYLRNLGAQNLAIRLRDVATGTVLRPSNPASTIVATGGGRLYDYALEATVLRVGTDAPTAGEISATGVIVLQVN
jgi:type 1 fimbria pilin